MVRTENGITKAQLMDEALLEKFFLSLNVRPRSVADYRYSLKSFFRYLNERGIEEPAREHVFAYRDSLLESGKKPSTVHAYVVAVKLFFRWLCQEGLYHDIANLVKTPGQRNEHRRYALTSRQALALLNHIDRSTLKGLRNYAMLTVMVVGGLRCVEVSRAKVGDFTRRGNDTVLYVYGKGRDDSDTEYIRLPVNARKAIREYLKERGNVGQNAPLFACTGNRNINGPLSTRTISKIAKDAMLTAGYDSDRLCAHSLRHTAVTLALKGGENLEAVKEFARHTNVNTTLIYSHAIDREHSTCSRTVEKVIFGGKRSGIKK